MSVAGQAAEATTNNAGKFDEDVDAACGNTITVRASWVDGGGARHVVFGTFNCPPCPKDKLAAAADPNSRQKRIAFLEGRIEELLAVQANNQFLLAAFQDQVNDLVNTDLSGLAGLPVEDQKKHIDQQILEEMPKLHNKFETARSMGPVPPSDLQWAILCEIFELLKKFTTKAFILQGLKPPQWPPFPPGNQGIT